MESVASKDREEEARAEIDTSDLAAEGHIKLYLAAEEWPSGLRRRS